LQKIGRKKFGKGFDCGWKPLETPSIKALQFWGVPPRRFPYQLHLSSGGDRGRYKAVKVGLGGQLYDICMEILDENTLSAFDLASNLGSQARNIGEYRSSGAFFVSLTNSTSIAILDEAMVSIGRCSLLFEAS
jgi:hypothetical protein